MKDTQNIFGEHLFMHRIIPLTKFLEAILAWSECNLLGIAFTRWLIFHLPALVNDAFLLCFITSFFNVVLFFFDNRQLILVQEKVIWDMNYQADFHLMQSAQKVMVIVLCQLTVGKKVLSKFKQKNILPVVNS